MTATQNFIFEGPSLPYLQEVNIGQFLEDKADNCPDKLAISSPWQKVSLTYRALRTSTKTIALGLLQIGLRPKDIVAVLAGNVVEYAQLFFAVGGIGATFAIVNPTFTPDEAIAAVEFLDPKVVVVADRIGFRNNRKLIVELATKQTSRSVLIQLGGSGSAAPKVTLWSDFEERAVTAQIADLQSLETHWAVPDPNEALCIQFTSGTTGPRKAAVLTHRNLINNAIFIGHRLGFTSSDVLCCCPPLFHCFGLVCGLLAGFAHECSVVIPSDVFNAEASLQAMTGYQCTVVHAIPTMFQAMLDYPHAQRYAPALSLRTGIIAGSSLSETLLRRLSADFNLHGLAYAFGMTELSAVSFLTTPSKLSLLEDRTSVGTLMPHTAAKVVDENLNTLGPGSRGELLVSGYLVFKEYHNNAEKTKDAVVIDDGGRRWMKTGDVVTIDENGACRVVGRSKDMIKKGGENIAPGDIEQLLQQHPDVAAAAIVGVPDSRWGETVGAFIQRQRPNSNSPTSRDIRVWMRNQIAPHKVPDYIYWIGEGPGVPSDLPVNASGKVIKSELGAAMVDLVTASK